MNKYGKKWLSALLVIAMMASLLVVPAGAVDVGEVGYKWDFTTADAAKKKSDPTASYAQWDAMESDQFEGLTLTNIKYHGTQYGVNASSGSIDIAVPGDCDIQVAVGHNWSVQLGTDTKTLKTHSDSTSPLTFHYKGEAGTATLNVTGTSYIASITLAEPTTPAPELKLDKDSVVVKMGATATVTPSVSNATMDAVTATPADDSIVTASVSDGVITLTPVAAGTTTVEVSVAISDAADGSAGPLTASISVRVLPAEVGTVSENQTIAFRGKTGAAQEELLYATGLEWVTTMDTTNGEGPNAKSPALNVYIPDGKQTTLTIEVCGFVGGQSATLEANGKAVTPTTGDMNENGGNKIFTVENATGKVELVFTSSSAIFIHSITVGAFTDTAAPCTKTEGCTLADGHEGECKVETPPEIGEDCVEAGTINFINLAGTTTTTEGAGNDARGPVPAVQGLSVSEGAVLQTAATSHGLTAKNNGDTVTLKLAAPAVITLVECQYGMNKITSVTADGTAVTIPVRWAQASGGDKELVFESVPAGDFVLTLGAGAFIHSIKVDYTTDQDPQMQLSDTTVSMKLNEDGSAVTTTVTALTRFTDGAIQVESKKPAVATAAVSGNVITLTAVSKGLAEVEVTVAGTDLKETLQVIVKAAGETYAADTDLNWNNTNAAYKELEKDAVNGLLDGLTFTGFTAAANGHGIQYANNATILMNLEHKATITVRGCQHGAAQNLVATCYAQGDADKTALGTPTEKGLTQVDNDTTGKIITIKDVPAGKVVLELSGGGSWLHGLGIHYTAEVEAGSRNIQIWDFAGKTETGEDYDNNITVQGYLDKDAAAVEVGKVLFQRSGDKKNTFAAGPTAFGNLSMYHEAGDRPYIKTDNAVLKELIGGYATEGKYVETFSDGYASLGAWYCNGAGSASKRYINVANVQAGDTIVFYAGSSSGEVVYHVVGPEEQTEDFTYSTDTPSPYTVVAQETGVYKIWPEGGKPVYYRVKLIPGIGVSGALDFTGATGFNESADYQLKFTNKTTKQVTYATVDKAAKTYKVSLAPGYTYSAMLTGTPGFGISTETKEVTPALSELKTGNEHDMDVVVREVYAYTGSITGIAAGYDVSKIAVTLTPEEGSGSDEVNLEIDKTTLAFTAQLDPGVEYTPTLSGVNDYEIDTPTVIVHEDAATENIALKLKAKNTASGKFVVLDVDDQFAPLNAKSTYEPLSATVTALVFENVDDGYTYTATVADGGYTAELRAGAYLAKATVNGYSTKTHVVVGDKAASKDLLFVSTATPAAVDYAADVYVDGVGGTDLHFKTVTGAMAYIKRMTRTDTQRVTVHIAPGTYREQISIDSKNVTFVNDTPGKEVKLTWYYGIGYTYYSAAGGSNLDNWYDAQNAFDKYAAPNIDVARWGTTVRVQAPGFQAQDITFENSFNYYLTEEEVADGVVPNGAQNIRFAREYGADVKSKTATERAAAIWVDTNNGRGDMTEFKNCKFLSSQDTFGTGKRMYLKDCYIEGMTDYICGPGDCVFDTCTLNWKGYSDTAASGYVTAPQTGASEKGYLFRNCYISADTNLKYTGGPLGRTWGAENTKCIFLNTTLQSADVISNASWGEMQGYNPANSTTLLEWGTVLADGTAVDLSKRTLQNTVAKAEPTAKPTDYFAGWVPEYYTEEVQGVELAAAPIVSDNGDINLPHPGHTLTVAYTLTPEANNANDNSTIQWYRVAEGGTETLVKTSSATAGKTYQIQEADVGAHIKVTVTPKTIGGQTGTAMSYTVAEAVQEGYDDPTGAVDPVLGAGVNVYLAGDSTVKDYSAAGMWNGGKLQAEGSWGEWLQQFFNDKVTVVNYAQGGRTTRSFIEQDGSLAKIDATMKEGDFLFIQFGHNDCHTADDRGVPLGIAKNDPQKSYAEGGVYPDTSLEANTYYPAGTKTYTAYLKDYLAVAKKHNATAVLMTPVARLYYTNGKIRPHHDATAFDGTSDNEYCKAVKWVYDWAMDNGYENNVLFMDNYQLTVDLFEMAYADGGNDTYARQLMNAGESTHNSKLGGLIEAAVIAQTIQNSDMTIAKAVKAPAQALGKTPKGETAFSVDGSGVLSAYDNLNGYVDHATYWEGKGQEMFDAIAAKAAELNGGTTPDDPAKPNTKALTDAIKAAKTEAANTEVSADGADVSTKNNWVTQAVKDAYEAAIQAAETVAAKADATQAEVDAAKAALDAATADFKAAQTAGTKVVSGGSTPAYGSGTTPSGDKVTTVTTVNDNGDKVVSVTTPEGDKTITATAEDGEVLAEVKLPATIAEPDTKFIDVPDDHWAAKAINDMAGLGMVKGVSEDTYDMVSPMTRGSIATIFHRLSNGGSGKTSNFADVAEGAWYADAIGWAAATGVVNGYSETAFGPDDTITRQQLAVMITRYARLLGMDTKANAVALDAFVDGSTADDWAADSLAWCVKNGVMKGRGGDVLDPTAAVTRAEAAVMLDRMIALIK